MKNITLASASILILIGTILFAAGNSPVAHGASTGTVCVIPSGSSSCPSSPSQITGAVGNQLRVSVFIQNSSGLNGFDITLLADHTILKPAGIDLTGTVLVGTPIIVVECLSSRLITGSTCLGTDTVDTLHLAAISALGSPLTSTPTTGLLFTSIYNVTGATSGTSLGFQTGCGSPSSPTSDQPFCVTLSNATPNPVPESIQTATFSTSTTPDFVIAAIPNSLTITAGSSASSTLIISSINGFSGTISLTATVSPTGLPFSLNPASVTLAPSQNLTSTLTLSTSSSTPSTTYVATVTGTSGSFSHTVSITVTVNPSPQPNFAITSSPSGLSITAGSSGASTITVTSLNGFTGAINLAASISPSGPAISLSSSSITLPAGGSGTTTLTVSTTPSTASGPYTVTVLAASGSISHAVAVSVTVVSTQPDFTITATPTSLTITPGASGVSSIGLHGVNGFNSTVFLTVSASSGLTATISPTSTGPFGTATLTVTSNTAGSYTAQVTGTSGSLSHTTTISVIVSSSSIGVVCIIPSGATSCASSPATIAGTPGSQVRVSIFIQGSGALNGFEVTLLADHTILKPAGIDLTGTVLLGTPVIVVECLSGVLIRGSVCPATDTINTIDLAATSALGSPLTPVPTTGLLFTALYNVTSTTSGIPLGFQTGCAVTSVSPNICVTIASGSPTPVPETVQTATFSTSTTPDFVISANPNSLTIPAGSSATSTITLRSINGLSGTVSLFTPAPPLCPQPGCSSWSLSVTSVSLSPNGTGTSTLTIFAGTTFPGPGNLFTVPVNGTIASLTHSVNVIFTTVAPDFSISASPSSLTIPAGSCTTSTFTLTSISGFNGTITLALSVSPAGPTATFSTAIISLAPGTSATTTLSVCTTTSTPSGSYTIAVAATSGSVSHTITIPLTVTTVGPGDFSISDSATSIAIPLGSERQTIVTVTSLNGFSGNVKLVATPSSTAVACWFTTLNNTATVFVPAGGSALQYPTCGAYGPPGTYTVTMSGTSGSLSHSVSLGVTVMDFSLSATSVSFNTGSSGTSTVTLTSLFGLSGPISLSVSTPSGLTGTCPSSVTLSSGGTSTASCTFASSTSGTYGATITGLFVCSDCYFNGHDPHSTNITVTVSGTGVPDFSMSALPSSLTFGPGSSATATIRVTSINGFSGTVSLTATHSNGIGAVINPTSVTGSGTATLTIGANQTGTFSIQVTGTSGTISHSVSISVTVASIGVVCIIPSGTNSCPISPASITGTTGSQLRVSVFIQGSGGLDGFDVTLLADHTILRPVGIDLTGTVLLGTPIIVLECVSTGLIHGGICSTTDTVDTIHLAATSALGEPLTPVPTTGLLFTAIYNVTGATSGIPLGFQTGCANTSVSPGICVTIASGSPTPVSETIQTATFSNSVPSPDFSFSASPSTITAISGTVGASTITVAPLNGFTGTIALASSVLPAGLTCALNVTSITLGPSQTSSLLCNGSVGTYTVTVTGTSGSLSHSAAVTFVVTDFALTANPTTLNILAGTTTTSTITVTAINGFTGTVTLSSNSPGLTTTFSPTSVFIMGGSATSTLTISSTSSTPAGSYVVSVRGASGTLSRTTRVSVTVTGTPDFTITATPTNQTVARGTSATFTITIKGMNGFNGTVSLSTTISPVMKNGPKISLPSTVGPYSNSTLTLSTTHSTPSGTYTITVTATSGSITHKVTITVIVTK